MAVGMNGDLQLTGWGGRHISRKRPRLRTRRLLSELYFPSSSGRHTGHIGTVVLALSLECAPAQCCADLGCSMLVSFL